MKLTIIIPVYNEEESIRSVIDEVLSLDLNKVIMEIIIVDDGSTDGTNDELDKITPRKKVKIIKHEVNKGKGEAIRSALQEASGDYILIQDADREYNPYDIPKLLMPIQKGHAQVVYGTRLKRWPNFLRDERKPIFLLHYLGNKILSLITSILYGQWITDMETGYKVIPLNLIRSINIESSGFAIEPEITAKILKMKQKIYEVNISTNPRGYESGKKLNTFRDGIKALYTLLKYKIYD